MNIVDPILFQASRQPPSAAICAPDSPIGLISYRRLAHFIHNVTRKLRGLALAERSTVAVNIDDVIFHAVVVLALARLGMATLSLREGGVSAPIKIDALVTTSRQPFLNMGRIVLVDLSWAEGDGEALPPHELPPTENDDLCRIILTSGSTNRPKAVALSHKLLASRTYRHATVFGNRLGRCQRIYCDVPISSSLGFQFLIHTLWRGGTAYFPGANFPSTLRMFEEYKIEGLVGSPGAFENLLRWFETVPVYQSNIEVAICGGDVLSRTLSDRFRARICSHLIAAYGSTEASMSATAHAHEIINVPRAVGFVTPGVAVQIVDDAGVVLPTGQEGVVRIKSEYAVDGYYGNPDETAKSFRDGWFYPGDLGTLDAHGLLSIAGREQSVLNVGGDKISPETIESALLQFRGVTEAVALSLPNDYGNNEICAVVVGREADQTALRAHCEAIIARPFAPARYIFVEGLPHNEMGKVDRRRVHEHFSQQRP